VDGLPSERELLVDVPDTWPNLSISVEQANGTAVPPRLALTETEASYRDDHRGWVTVNRAQGRARFDGPRRLSPDEIVHTRLGMLAAVFAQWLGRTAFHAASFVGGAGAWGVFGERESGKSTVMAGLAISAVTVLGDDTMVIEEGRCLSSVRCIDLRLDSANVLGVTCHAPLVRKGLRRRLILGPAPQQTPLAGWLFLAQGEALSARALPLAERLERIAGQRRWHRRGVTDPRDLVEFAALPAWELRCPRDWSLLPATIELVRELTGA
jgi:hypothetical protein